MTTTEGGWTTISREVVPLLYENAATVWLGFKDPSLPLPEVVTKVFMRLYTIEQPYRTLEIDTETGRRGDTETGRHGEGETEITNQEPEGENQEPKSGEQG